MGKTGSVGRARGIREGRADCVSLVWPVRVAVLDPAATAAAGGGGGRVACAQLFTAAYDAIV